MAEVDAKGEEYERGDVWVLEEGEAMAIVECSVERECVCEL